LVSSLRSVQRTQSLHIQTYQALRTAIISGELSPGERLVETHLAQMLQVSRTPIREAIRQLQQEYLVVLDASGAMRVATISIADAVHLYDCRIALEQLSVVGACENATQEQLQALHVMVQEAEQLMLSSPSLTNTLQRLDLDSRFHRLLARSSGNLWLVSLLDQVFDKMALLRIQTTQSNPDVLEIRLEHRLIYQAVSDRHPKDAVVAIKQHLKSSQESVIKAIQQLKFE
jgi:DNA-binding GntR family transcriptional regulator